MLKYAPIFLSFQSIQINPLMIRDQRNSHDIRHHYRSTTDENSIASNNHVFRSNRNNNIYRNDYESAKEWE